MPDDAYLDPYRDAALHHGNDFTVTLWASEASQVRRFAVFTEMCDLEDKRILDAGCSRGDLAGYLIERGLAFAHYTGIDGLPKVIDYAASRKLPNCDFLAGDFVAEPDLLGRGDPQVILISGTLNTMTDTQAMAVLEAAWRHAGEALAFNFLSDRCGPGAPPQDDFARRLDTLRLIEWATSKTWCVTFRQDYFRQGHDATIAMRKV